MFFSFGLFDGKPEQAGAKQTICTTCGFDGFHKIYKQKRWILLFFIPLPIRTTTYIQCPRCGSTTYID